MSLGRGLRRRLRFEVRGLLFSVRGSRFAVRGSRFFLTGWIGFWGINGMGSCGYRRMKGGRGVWGIGG
jgi:hypothetical protein